MTDLDELAAEMRVIDLGPRVRQAHRRGVRRRFAVGGCAVVLAALIAVLAVVWPRPPAPPAGQLPGSLVTMRDTGTEVVVHVDGDERLRLPGDAVDLTVSPNGKWLAWRQSGDYRVADLDGGKPRTIAESGDACQAPAWASDGEPRLLTGTADGDIAWHSSESGKETATLDIDRERSSNLCRVFPVPGDNGYDLYYGTASGGFELRYLSPDGEFTDTGIMKRLRDQGTWEALTAIAPDGERACIRAEAGDRRCDALIDLASGKLVAEPGAAQAWFTPDGDLLTAEGEQELALRDPSGAVTDRAAAPKNAEILAYFPD